MPLYTFENPATGATMDLHLPVARRDDGPKGWVRHTVPERLGHVGTLTSEESHCTGQTLNGFKEVEQTPGGLDEIRRECGMSVDAIKRAWAAALVFLLLTLPALGGDLSTGYTFANGETNITHTKLNAAVNGATINPSFIGNKSRPLTAQASDQFPILRGNNLYKLNLQQCLQAATNLNFYSFGSRIELSPAIQLTNDSSSYPMLWPNTNITKPTAFGVIFVKYDGSMIDSTGIWGETGSHAHGIRYEGTNVELMASVQFDSPFHLIDGSAFAHTAWVARAWMEFPAADPVFYLTNVTQVTNQYFTTNVPAGSVGTNALDTNVYSLFPSMRYCSAGESTNGISGWGVNQTSTTNLEYYFYFNPVMSNDKYLVMHSFYEAVNVPILSYDIARFTDRVSVFIKFASTKGMDPGDHFSIIVIGK